VLAEELVAVVARPHEGLDDGVEEEEGADYQNCISVTKKFLTYLETCWDTGAGEEGLGKWQWRQLTTPKY